MKFLNDNILNKHFNTETVITNLLYEALTNFKDIIVIAIHVCQKTRNLVIPRILKVQAKTPRKTWKLENFVKKTWIFDQK